jgi:hypothetical protein
LDGFPRLAGNKKIPAIMKRIRNAALGRAAFPNLNFQKAIGGTARISDF